jgi:glycosyltransferase involved in cell wall biosynthesis
MSLKVSVITCTLNSVAFLRNSIQSVLTQDYPHIEYIFVDGGSDDGTIDIIRSVFRPHVLVSGTRNGISAAMNEGIECATGDVIAHLHSDDYYFNANVLSQVVETLETQGAEWCFGRAMNLIDGTCAPEAWDVPCYSLKRLQQGNFIPHPSTFVRRRVFERVGGYDPALRYAMDYDMWLRIGALYQPVQIDRHLSVVRYHDQSLSFANQLDALREDFDVRLKHMGNRLRCERSLHHARYLFRKFRLKRARREQRSES